MATWEYQVKYIYKNSTNTFVTPVDITTNVITIENMTDVGTGEVNTATIQLNARDGQFITIDNGTTPKINQFDRIYIKLTDKNGATFEKMYEVETLKQNKTINEGIRLIIELMGMERHLQQVHFAKQYNYANAFYVAKDICNKYNGSKGGKQITLEKQDTVNTGSDYYNGLPKWTSNNIDFGVSETYAYDGIDELVNKMGSSVSAGGSGDFYEFNFEDDLTLGSGKYNANKMKFHAFSSGANPNQSSIPTVTATNTLPIYSTNGTLEDETGSVIFAKGAKAYGSMPTNSSKFRGYKEEFILIPDYVTGEVYPAGARVRYTDGKRYQASQETSSSWDAAEWYEIKLGDVITLAGDNGLSFIYSPYTSSLTKSTSSSGSGNDGSDGYKLMISSGSNPDDTTADHGSATSSFDWHGCWDSNLVIRDEDHFRTWVDIAQVSSTLPTELQQDGGAYRGCRVLVNGTGTGDFVGFNNRVMQYDGSAWKQLYPYNNGTTPHADAQIAVIRDGKNHVWNGSAWVLDDATVDKSNDCFHPATKVFSEDGIATSLKSTSAVTSDYMYGENSASVWEYSFSVFDGVAGYAFTAPNYYQIGAWACFRLPYPTTSYQLPSGYTVGSLYKNATIDTNNMHLTPDANNGFNADDSEELGIMESLAFFIKFKYFYNHVSAGETLLPFTGKFKFRATLYDTSDNVVVQDFEVAFNNNWEYISLPLSGFKIYRARVTKRWANAIANMIVPELEVTEVFEWKNVKMLSIQCQESYDGEGRFDATSGQINDILGYVFNPAVTLTGGMWQKTRLSIDNLHFTKQLTATSGAVGTGSTARNIEPIFMDRPYTTNYRQLKQDALSQKEIEQFRFEAFDIETEGECPANLRFGDSFYLTDDSVVEASDNGANTIKLVAKKITYTINGTDGGKGGFVRKIQGVKRI